MYICFFFKNKTNKNPTNNQKQNPLYSNFLSNSFKSISNFETIATNLPHYISQKNLQQLMSYVEVIWKASCSFEGHTVKRKTGRKESWGKKLVSSIKIDFVMSGVTSNIFIFFWFLLAHKKDGAHMNRGISSENIAIRFQKISKRWIWTLKLSAQQRQWWKGGFPGEPPEDCDGLCFSGRGQETGSTKVLNPNSSNKTLVKHFISNTLQNVGGISDWDAMSVVLKCFLTTLILAYTI